MRLQERVGGVLRGCFFAFVFLMMIAIACEQAAAQTAAGRVARISGPIDETNRVILHGNTHPLARPQYDRGAVADSQPLHRMLLVLQRSAAQETALRSFLDQQQSKSSSSYHQWLTAQQFGQQFGPADADVQTVTGWLASHGFEVARVSPGKTVVEFSGTAGQVRQAFQTEIHRYVVNGKEHFGNSSDPSIPAALAPVVAGPATLHNFPKRPQSRVAGVFQKSKSTGKVTPVKAGGGNSANPLYNFPSEFCPVGGICYALGPADFDTIYNVPTSGTPGSGQTIAIVGDSEICTATTPAADTGSGNAFVAYWGNEASDVCEPTSTAGDDVAQFRSLFGLPANNQACSSSGATVSSGPVCVIVAGTDPGFTYDETEGDLDTEWAGTVAPNATEDFVISADTETTGGIDLAAEYIVDNNLAPVMSESFGECEYFLGNSENAFYYYLWEEAAAQGQSVIISAGDTGSATCDAFDIDEAPVGAQYGLMVNGIGSTPFNVVAGGTDFDVNASGYPSSYWLSCSSDPCTNGANGQSAKSYIPELTWNDSCAQNTTGSTTTCSLSTSSSSDTLNIVGGGGGESNCALYNSGCESGYAKPSWQSGPYVTGLASTDGVRDLPDISFFAADGFKSGSFYIVCEQDTDPSDNTCSLTGNDFFDFIGVGGTSSSAPAFAGTMALVNQEMTTLHAGNAAIPTRQGNANYVLYPLANKQETNALPGSPTTAGTACSSTGPPNAACVFNDVTLGNNSVPCYFNTANCNAANSSLYGVLVGTPGIAWGAGTGYDFATGLGTINVGKLVSDWSSVAGSFTGTSTSLQICGPATCTPGSGTSVSMTHGSAADLKITVTPTSGSIPSATSATPENAALIMTTSASACTPNNGSANIFTNIASFSGYEVTNANVFSLSSGGTTGTVATSYLAGGTYYVKAHYTGDGTFGASDSNCVSVVVNPESSTTTLTAPVLNFANEVIEETLTAPGGGTVEYGDSVLLRADVKGSTSGQENASGTVTFKDGSTTLATVAVNAEGYAELQTGANPDGFSTTPLTVGSHTITATYNGGASYSASAASPSIPLTVDQATTATTFTTGSVEVSPGTQVSVGILVDTFSANNSNPSGGSLGKAPTGTVTFSVAAATPPAPRSRPGPNGWLLVGLAAMLGLLLQIARGVSLRRRWGAAFAGVLLALVAAAAIGCGGGGSGSSGGTGSGSGTTIGTRSLTATTDSEGFVAGTATLQFTPTSSVTITATYGGDTNYRTSTTSTITVGVN